MQKMKRSNHKKTCFLQEYERKKIYFISLHLILQVTHTSHLQGSNQLYNNNTVKHEAL